MAARTYNLLSELVEAFATAALSRDRPRRDPEPEAEPEASEPAAPETETTPESTPEVTPEAAEEPARRAYKRRMGHGPLPPGQGWLIAIAPELHSHGLDFINLLQSPEMRA
ncbi:MAG: hypothetical protein KGI51_05785, partial [Rhodospirillales bacterium]|nr:hypothetical protein [Rhodospirillales bacterium]